MRRPEDLLDRRPAGSAAPTGPSRSAPRPLFIEVKVDHFIDNGRPEEIQAAMADPDQVQARPRLRGEPVSRDRPVDVLLRRLDPDVPVPAYGHPGDAGADLVTTEAAELAPGERAVLPTGVSIALPEGYAAFVHPRSGLAARCGVALVNAPGTVDAGYRGEIKVIVVNLDPRESVRFERFDRIAQLVVQQVEKVRFHEVAELPGSARAEGGFGSTGGHAAVVTASADTRAGMDTLRSYADREGQ